MGQAACAAVDDAVDLELVARIDPDAGLDDVSTLADSKAEVAVDFTHITALRRNGEEVLGQGVHLVVGTSGWTSADADALAAASERGGVNCLLAPNFAIGAVLMMKMAEMCAPFFERAEVIEYHHDGKADAPSGTARATAALMSKARDEWPDRGDSEELVPSARGAMVQGVRVHAVRLPGVVANQEVILGTTGQTLTIRHDTTDRSSFMPGVLLAVRRIADFPGLTIGLEKYLDL